MIRLRILGLAIVAVFALGGSVSAVAQAAPEFHEKAGKEVKAKKFTGKSGVGKLIAAGTTVECKKDESTGEIEGTKKVTNVVVTFKECEAEKEGKKCKVNGGTIKTNTLVGELGEVAVAEAESGVGLDLKAKEGKVFVTLEGECLPISPAKVEGSVIGEVKPVKKLSKTGELVYTTAAGKQKIQNFVGAGKDTLEVFKIAEATETTTDETKFEEEVEVT